ncbi:phage head closure protein [Chitinophaga sp. Hz27]|uniref:phage head closure protein n=1 Tax=Chitinophaga sp. Hz27 TaxID=3347169 RepID=UPI0035E0D066
MLVRRFDIGKADRKIAIRGFSSVSDGYGGTTDTEVDLITPWAMKLPITSVRDLISAELVFTDTVQYLIRWRSDFEPLKDMKIVDAGKEYSINGVVEIQASKRCWLLIAKINT